MTGKAKRILDFISMACTSASVSYREVLTREELVDALNSGKIPRSRVAHFQTLLEEAPQVLIRGLIEQVSQTSGRARIEQNILRIADELQVADHVRKIVVG